MNTIIKTGCIALAAITAAAGLSACSSGYGDTSYSSFSVGVSSARPYGYSDGYGYRDRDDFDGDGVPNWADRRPRNPYVD